MQGMNVTFRCTFHTSRHTSPGTSQYDPKTLRPPAETERQYNAHIVPGDAPKTTPTIHRSRPRYAARFLKRRVVSVTAH